MNIMKRAFFTLLAVICVAMTASAQQPFVLKLYPDGVQESNGLNVDTPDNPREPILTVYLPKGRTTGQTVVICPGGGYAHLSLTNEGSEVAQWLNMRGIAAAVLSYRMPNGHSEIPLKDALTAIEMVRDNAAEWKVDPSKVGIIGFSAGGHLAATALTKYTSEKNRPDFGILIYPVITMTMATHGGSRYNLLGRDHTEQQINDFSCEKLVNDKTPVTFIALSSDDKVVLPVNGVSFYQALSNADVKGCELHVYPTGGHGWGFSGRLDYRDEFSTSLTRWLNEINK